MASHGNLEEMEVEESRGVRGLLRRYRSQLVAVATLLVFCMVAYAIVAAHQRSAL